MVTDLDLLQGIRNGDPHALDALYHRYLPAVWRFAFSQFPRDEPTARDIVSETFLAALRSIGTLDLEKGSVASWLIGIAHHKITDLQRRPSVSSIPAGAPDPPTAESSDPSFPLAQQELRQSVALIMLQLPDDQRLVLDWKYLEDLSVREIAARLGRTEKAVEALLYRARIEFRSLYQNQLDAPRRSP